MDKVFAELRKEESEISTRSLQSITNINDSFKFLHSIFMKKDSRLIDIVLPDIALKIDDKKFQEKVVALTKKEYEREILTLTGHKRYDPVKEAILKATQKKLEDISFQNIRVDYQALFQSSFRAIGVQKDDLDFFEERYANFRVAELFYDDYKRKNSSRFEVPKNNQLLKIYRDHDIDLESSDEQYCKYKLLSIDENFVIINGSIPKVFDKRLSEHLIINEIPSEVLTILSNLLESKAIKSLALRPEYSVVPEGRKNRSELMEAVQRGKIFSFQNIASPLITKLYSKDEYGNNLWINIDGENITFEELIDDFSIEGDSIVTQILHLEYFFDTDNHFINHIDHEYIFYSADEYAQRITNHKVKGEHRPRFKTFKVDKSRIPFFLDTGEFFLYVILEHYFTRKDLLTEYFEQVIKNNKVKSSVAPA